VSVFFNVEIGKKNEIWDAFAKIGLIYMWIEILLGWTLDKTTKTARSVSCTMFL
jgi:hypothetical protein